MISIFWRNSRGRNLFLSGNMTTVYLYFQPIHPNYERENGSESTETFSRSFYLVLKSNSNDGLNCSTFSSINVYRCTCDIRSGI